MSTSGQKRRDLRVEDDDTSSSSEDGERVLLRTVRSVASSNFEVAERIPQCAAPAVALRAFEEHATREVFKRYPSQMTFKELKSCASEYRLPCDSRLMVPSPDDHAAFPLAGYMAVSPQHLEFGFRFPLHPYLVAILNDLKLAPFQLTPNSYAQITSLALLFRKNELSFPTPKILRYLYSFKSTKDGLYYMAARLSDCKKLLPQGKAKTGPTWGTTSPSGFIFLVPLFTTLTISVSSLYRVSGLSACPNDRNSFVYSILTDLFLS